MAHVDLVSSTAALAYLDEVQGVWSDRETLRRDLLELLLAGDDPEAARRHAASLATNLVDDYAVVVLRARQRPPDDSLPATLRERNVLRDILDATRSRLGGSGGRALVGLRHGEVVALCPVAGRDDHGSLRGRCESLAEALAGSGVAVGLGGWHEGHRHRRDAFPSTGCPPPRADGRLRRDRRQRAAPPLASAGPREPVAGVDACRLAARAGPPRLTGR